MEENLYENSDRKMSDRELIRKTWKYIRPYRSRLLVAMVFMLLLVVFDLITPIITSDILKELTIQYDEFEQMIPIDIVKVFVLSGVYFVTIVSNSICIYINTMLLQKVGQSVIYDLRMVVFEHIDSLSLSQLNEIPVGSLVTRLTQRHQRDVRSVHQHDRQPLKKLSFPVRRRDRDVLHRLPAGSRHQHLHSDHLHRDLRFPEIHAEELPASAEKFLDHECLSQRKHFRHEDHADFQSGRTEIEGIRSSESEHHSVESQRHPDLFDLPSSDLLSLLFRDRRHVSLRHASGPFRCDSDQRSLRFLPLCFQTLQSGSTDRRSVQRFAKSLHFQRKAVQPAGNRAGRAGSAGRERNHPF